MAKAKKLKKRKKVSTKSTSKKRTIKERMSKAQLLVFLVNHLEAEHEEITDRLASKDVKRLVASVVEGIGEAIDRSIRPGGGGEFIMPKMFKVFTKTKKAIKKGTKVRNPATGEMIKSKGRPASKQVKIRPLVQLKRAAAGDT